MKVREAVTLRAVLLLQVAVLGVCAGFWWNMNTVPVPLEQHKELHELKERAARLPVSRLKHVRISLHKQGPCVVEITADSMTYPVVAEPVVKLLRPHVRRYTKDGQILMDLWGDRGSAVVKEGMEEFEDVKVEGNAVMRRYATKVKDEEDGAE